MISPVALFGVVCNKSPRPSHHPPVTVGLVAVCMLQTGNIFSCILPIRHRSRVVPHAPSISSFEALCMRICRKSLIATTQKQSRSSHVVYLSLVTHVVAFVIVSSSFIKSPNKRPPHSAGSTWAGAAEVTPLGSLLDLCCCFGLVSTGLLGKMHLLCAVVRERKDHPDGLQGLLM